MTENEIKTAFKKAKEDIYFLAEEMNHIKLELIDIKSSLKQLSESLDKLRIEQLFSSNLQQTDKPTDRQTHPASNQAIQHITPTQADTPTDKPALEALKPQFSRVSTGNEGVPTDRQTNQQTDRHITNTNLEYSQKPKKLQQISNTAISTALSTSEIPTTNNLQDASQILKNLDALKKELRLKFKRLTTQEMAIFSLIYSFDEQGEIIDYPFLATKTNLSESSIRDYTHKITLKGIPILKEKINNKRIILHISPDLKKLASLDTILKLREL